MIQVERISAQRSERRLRGRVWAPGPQADAQRFSQPAQQALSARAVERFNVCPMVLDRSVGSRPGVVGAARARGEELGVLFRRQGEQLVDPIHQGVQVAVQPNDRSNCLASATDPAPSGLSYRWLNV